MFLHSYSTNNIRVNIYLNRKRKILKIRVNYRSYILQKFENRCASCDSLNRFTVDLIIVIFSPCCHWYRSNAFQYQSCRRVASYTRRHKCTLSFQAWYRRTPQDSTYCYNVEDSQTRLVFLPQPTLTFPRSRRNRGKPSSMSEHLSCSSFCTLLLFKPDFQKKKDGLQLKSIDRFETIV